MFSSILGLCPWSLPVATSPQVTTMKNVSRHCHMSVVVQNRPWVRTPDRNINCTLNWPLMCVSVARCACIWVAPQILMCAVCILQMFCPINELYSLIPDNMYAFEKGKLTSLKYFLNLAVKCSAWWSRKCNYLMYRPMDAGEILLFLEICEFPEGKFCSETWL